VIALALAGCSLYLDDDEVALRQHVGFFWRTEAWDFASCAPLDGDFDLVQITAEVEDHGFGRHTPYFGITVADTPEVDTGQTVIGPYWNHCLGTTSFTCEEGGGAGVPLAVGDGSAFTGLDRIVLSLTTPDCEAPIVGQFGRD
jgi:hypothetical protein